MIEVSKRSAWLAPSGSFFPSQGVKLSGSPPLAQNPALCVFCVLPCQDTSQAIRRRLRGARAAGGSAGRVRKKKKLMVYSISLFVFRAQLYTDPGSLRRLFRASKKEEGLSFGLSF